MAISAVLLASVIALAAAGGVVGAVAVAPATATTSGGLSLTATNTTATFCATPGAPVSLSWSASGPTLATLTVLGAQNATLYTATGTQGNATFVSPGAITAIAEMYGGSVQVTYSATVSGTLLGIALGVTTPTTC